MMSQSIDIHLLPELVPPGALAGATVVVIDVLRASTTIATALAAGATHITPCLEIEEARRLAADFPPPGARLGGERQGRRIEGFDLGNSPAEYTEEMVGDRAIVFSTTNGTKALAACREASRVVLGAPINLKATCEAIAEAGHVHLVCSGTAGHVAREDVLAAGAIAYHFERETKVPCSLNDAGQLALAAWRNVAARAMGAGIPLGQRLAEEFRDCLGGKNLIALGLDADLAAAAQIDHLRVVPELDLQSWRITALGP